MYWQDKKEDTGSSKSSQLFLTLPEGEKDDRLDHEELEYGVVRDEQFTCSKVEEEERVERQADRDVVNNSDIQVATSHTGGDETQKEKHWGKFIFIWTFQSCETWFVL